MFVKEFGYWIALMPVVMLYGDGLRTHMQRNSELWKPTARI